MDCRSRCFCNQADMASIKNVTKEASLLISKSTRIKDLQSQTVRHRLTETPPIWFQLYYFQITVLRLLIRLKSNRIAANTSNR